MIEDFMIKRNKAAKILQPGMVFEVVSPGLSHFKLGAVFTVLTAPKPVKEEWNKSWSYDVLTEGKVMTKEYTPDSPFACFPLEYFREIV